MAAAMNEPSDECYEGSKQNQAADNFCPAIGKAAFTLEPATAQKSQHTDTDTMRQIVDYEVCDEVHSAFLVDARLLRAGTNASEA